MRWAFAICQEIELVDPRSVEVILQGSRAAGEVGFYLVGGRRAVLTRYFAQLEGAEQ
jgi:hypothetical protein